MSTLAATFSQLHAPSTKTAVTSLLQALAFAAMLYVAALLYSATSDTVAVYGKEIQTLYRWAWVAPAPFYAIGIGIKLAADALGKPSIASNIWLRMPARIAFSIPTILLIACEVYYTVTTIGASQSLDPVVELLITTIGTIIAALAVLCYYVNTLDGLKDKPVADALFTSLFPVMPFLAILAGVAIAILYSFAIALTLLPALLCSTSRSK